MLKPILIAITFAVLIDAAAFDGIYRDEVVGAAIRLGHTLVTLDWSLTHT